MHVHSAASYDCAVAPGDVARELLRWGLRPVFLTDHDTLEGAHRLRDERGVRVVCGQEVTTGEGDLIGLFLSRPVLPRLGAERAAHEIREQGGLVYLPHPYDRRRHSLCEATIERVRDVIDIVEVHNGRCRDDENRRAEELCEILDAARGAGSDAHTRAELGGVYVEMEDFDGARDFLRKLAGARIVVRPSRMRMRLERVLAIANWRPATSP